MKTLKAVIMLVQWFSIVLLVGVFSYAVSGCRECGKRCPESTQEKKVCAPETKRVCRTEYVCEEGGVCKTEKVCRPRTVCRTETAMKEKTICEPVSGTTPATCSSKKECK